MKKVLTTVAVVGIMAAAATAFGESIANSKHNLAVSGLASIKGTAGNSSQICIYCHAPHNAKLADKYIWNRNNPTASTFSLYSGQNMQSRQFKTGFTADSTSLFCMSCHDGSTNMNAVANKGALINYRALGYAGTAGLNLVSASVGGTANFGTNLATTHPVNFPVQETNVYEQNDLFVGSDGTKPFMGNDSLYYPGTNGYPLFTVTGAGGGRDTTRSLECSSCHAVHDATYSPFLRYTMEGSKLCLGCHNK